MSSFTVRDLGMINNAVTAKRWPGVKTEVKLEVNNLIEGILNDPQESSETKLRASNLLLKIEKFNLDVDATAPKLDVHIDQMSDEQLQAALAQLEGLEERRQIGQSGTETSEAEIIEGETTERQPTDQ